MIGPIFRLQLGKTDMIVIADHKLFDEICDENRFIKTVAGSANETRLGIHDGLFTAYASEHNWGVAHRILIPEFGPLAIRDMFDGLPNPHVLMTYPNI